MAVENIDINANFGAGDGHAIRAAFARANQNFAALNASVIALNNRTFNPASIAGLAVWLDGREPLSSNFAFGAGNAVAGWQDKSGNNNHAIQATAANQPIYDNVKRLVKFDGVNDQLNFTNPAAFNGPYTVLMFMEASTPLPVAIEIPFAHSVAGSFNNSSFTSVETNGDVRQSGIVGSVVQINNFPGIPTNAGEIYSTANVNQQNNFKQFKNGLLVRTDLTGDIITAGTDQARLGSNWSGTGNFYSGGMRDFLVYAGVKTDAEILTVHNGITGRRL